MNVYATPVGQEHTVKSISMNVSQARANTAPAMILSTATFVNVTKDGREPIATV
jgi:hypothetical protein